MLAMSPGSDSVSFAASIACARARASSSAAKRGRIATSAMMLERRGPVPALRAVMPSDALSRSALLDSEVPSASVAAASWLAV